MYTRLGEGQEGITYKWQNMVIKTYKAGKRPNIVVNELLQQLDPGRKRFIWYDILAGELNENFKNVVFMPYMEHIPKHLTKAQYRYLRDSVELLRKNNILHGDLPDNVMLDPVTELPVIIDFDQARINNNKDLARIDSNAFLTHFKT